MKNYKVDRIDNKYVYCTDKDGKLYALDIKEVPQHIKTKDIIKIDDDGVITIQMA